MADEWAQAAAEFHGGNNPHAAPAAGSDDWKVWGAGSNAPADPGFWSTLGHDAMAMPGSIANAVTHPLDTAKGMIAAQGDQFSKAGDAINGRGEFKNMTPMERGASAIGHGVAGLIPGVGPAAAQAGDEIGSGQYGAGAAHAVESLAPMAVPAMASVAGKGLQSAAVPMAESALGVKAIQRAYGKTPGLAALEETKGIRPATVAASAQDRLNQLTPQLEAAAAKSQVPASLNPARQVIDSKISKAQAGNSIGSGRVAELGNMRQQLTSPGPNFAGAVDPATGEIATDQSPANLLRMKREFGNDFTKWNPLHPTADMATARQAYRALDDELDRTVPEGKDLNQRISSLIPIKQQAELKDLQAGVIQNTAHRVAAHTGALALSAGAGYAGGGIPGAIAAPIVQELISTPTARMAAARGLYGAGKAAASSAGGRAAQGAVATSMGRAISQAQQGQQQ